MNGRAFYRRRGFWLGLFVLLGMAVLAGSVMWVPSRGQLNAQRRAVSGDGELVAFALPVSGADTRGPKDGLMVYLSGKDGTVMDRRATSLKGTLTTRLRWVAGVEPRSFEIWDKKGMRMVWRVEGERMVCVEGMEFLVEKREVRDE